MCECKGPNSACSRLVTKTAMCETCPAGTLGPSRYGRGVVACSIDGKPIAKAITRACPRGRHPDAEGIVRWAGIRWFGVPMPLRVKLRLWHPRHPRLRRWDGCGCVVILKRGTETFGLFVRMMTLPSTARWNTEQSLQEIGYG